MSEQRIVVNLSGCRPVRIDPEAWPVMAHAHGSSFCGGDYCRKQQALAQREVDEYTLTVREHNDGRRLVYGRIDAAGRAWNMPAAGHDRDAGYLYDDPAKDVVEMMQMVYLELEEYGLPNHLFQEWLNDLPPADLG